VTDFIEHNMIDYYIMFIIYSTRITYTCIKSIGTVRNYSYPLLNWFYKLLLKMES